MLTLYCDDTVLQSTSQQGNLIPDPSATYKLYDRVVNISVSSTVPFGLRGTIIGIRGGKRENPAINLKNRNTVHILTYHL